MEARRDALRGAARMVEAVNALAAHHAPDGRATVGFMQVSPNSRNVIPGLVKMTVDLRHPDDCISRRWIASFAPRRPLSPAELRLECDLQQVDHFPASRFDPGCVGAVRAAARALGYSHREMVSGAGHDAIYVARVAPTGDDLRPCKDGISHNEIEDCPSRTPRGGGQRAAARDARAGPQSGRHPLSRSAP
jgi:N-carbamoyl-L-amino-acid hydrolase